MARCYWHLGVSSMDWRIFGGIGLGIAVGIISGLIGVGGGIVMVPALILLFRMHQTLALVTSLAMLLPPAGILAFMMYFRGGEADLKLGLFMSLGVFLGGYFGADWAQQISGPTLRRV